MSGAYTFGSPRLLYPADELDESRQLSQDQRWLWYLQTRLVGSTDTALRLIGHNLYWYLQGACDHEWRDALDADMPAELDAVEVQQCRWCNAIAAFDADGFEIEDDD